MRLIRLPVFLLLCTAVLCLPARASEPPETSAASWVLMDASSGRVLAGECPDEPRLVASTTKIMTALLVLENCDPDEAVVIEPEWTGIEGSTMYLETGERLTVHELLCGLLLASGNDAAEALACVTAGDAESFATLMNERAAALGCENTHFENPSGLDGEDHRSSARDLALITREAIGNESFREIVSMQTAEVGGRTFTNHNRLLRECEGVFGVKTGYTEAAGRTLVTCCERGGITLICVTLNDPDDWVDHAALYDWAYGKYVLEDVLAGRVWTIPVIGGTEETAEIVCANPVPVLLGREESISVSAALPSFVYAEVTAGQEAGTANISIDGLQAASIPLVYAGTVQRRSEEERDFFDWLQVLLGASERKIYTLS